LVTWVFQGPLNFFGFSIGFAAMLAEVFWPVLKWTPGACAVNDCKDDLIWLDGEEFDDFGLNIGNVHMSSSYACVLTSNNANYDLRAQSCGWPERPLCQYECGQGNTYT
jgi:hypothetical protein